MFDYYHTTSDVKFPHEKSTTQYRLAHQPEREEGFLSHPNSFAIYQMDHDLDSIPLRFSSYDELAEKDIQKSGGYFRYEAPENCTG